MDRMDSVRHKIYTKTEKYSVQAVRFIKKYSGLKVFRDNSHYKITGCVVIVILEKHKKY